MVIEEPLPPEFLPDLLPLILEEELPFEPPSQELPEANDQPWQDEQAWRRLALTKVAPPKRRHQAVDAQPEERPTEKRDPAKSRKLESEVATFVEPAPLADKNRPPSYPERARRRGQEGEVALNGLVGIDGRVKDVRVIKSSGHATLDREAKRAISQWLFSPATHAQVVVEAWHRVDLVFQLVD